MMTMTTDPNILHCGDNFVCPRDPTAAQRHALIVALAALGITSEEVDFGGGCISVTVDSERSIGHWSIVNAESCEPYAVWGAMFWAETNYDHPVYDLIPTSASAEEVAAYFAAYLQGTR